VRRVAVAATAPLGADVLERLAAHVPISWLLTRPDRPQGRGRKVGAPPAKLVAERLGIEVRQPERLTPETPVDADVVVVCAYGLLIPDELLAQALWLNVHPSLLPRWRGAAPVERSLLAGDAITGVTIHETVQALDAGPIAAQRSFPVGPLDDAGAIYARCGELAVELLLQVIPAPAFVPQAEEGVTYAAKLGPEDRAIDWSEPAEVTLNRIRALSPHIGARGVVRGRPVTVWQARPAGPDAGRSEVLVEGGLELVEVQPDGKRRMSGEEFLRGVRA
jgi:methionyl-tRNA formyltransferase